MSSSSNSSTTNNAMGTGASSKLSGKSNGVSSDVVQLDSNKDSASKHSASCSSSTSSSISSSAYSQNYSHAVSSQLHQQQQTHSCEICGLSSLSDDSMREHTRQCHVEGNECPFCGISGIAAAELLLHVNQAHLDYLTPENELMSFIDDQTPSIDGDSDSMSECRGLSPSITEIPGIITNHSSISYLNRNCNGYSNNYKSQNGTVKLNGSISANGDSSKSSKVTCNGGAASCMKMSNGVKENVVMSMSMTSSTGSTSSSSSTTNKILANDHQILNNLNNNSNLDNLSSNNCDMNGSELSASMNGNSSSSEPQQPQQQHGEGSPLRSQLGLKLKANKPKIITTTSSSQAASNNSTTNKASPLQCLLCPYKTDNPSVLEEHINRSHFDPLSPSVNGSQHQQSQGSQLSAHNSTLDALQCPICIRCFESCSDLELHVNIEHRDILSPAKIDQQQAEGASNGVGNGECALSCPVCGISFENMKTQEMELHIEKHFAKSPSVLNQEPDLEKQAQKLREQREFEMLRAQYGMDDQGNFREQSAAAMQRAVYAGEMSVADYYERQVGLRAAESHGVDDGSSCTKSVAARVLSLSSSSPGVIKSYVCSGVDHYASSYGDKGWGCGYRNLQMMLSSLLQNTAYNEALYSAWGSHGPARTAMPSISRLQKMVEAAWAQGFDVQGKEQLGCKLYNTRKWIGATEIVTVLSWLRIKCQLVDFHKPTSPDGRHPELFNWVLRYFEEPKVHTPPLYLQHQGHSRTIIGIEQKSSGLTLLVLDPSHGPRQVAVLGSSQDSLRLIRRGPNAMKAPQYQIVAVRGLIEVEEEYQASKVLQSLRIPPDR